jgi:hypothetical protein
MHYIVFYLFIYRNLFWLNYLYKKWPSYVAKRYTFCSKCFYAIYMLHTNIFWEIDPVSNVFHFLFWIFSSIHFISILPVFQEGCFFRFYLLIFDTWHDNATYCLCEKQVYNATCGLFTCNCNSRKKKKKTINILFWSNENCYIVDIMQ